MQPRPAPAICPTTHHRATPALNLMSIPTDRSTIAQSWAVPVRGVLPSRLTFLKDQRDSHIRDESIKPTLRATRA